MGASYSRPTAAPALPSSPPVPQPPRLPPPPQSPACATPSPSPPRSSPSPRPPSSASSPQLKPVSPRALSRARRRLILRRARRHRHKSISQQATKLLGSSIQFIWPGTGVWVDCQIHDVDFQRKPYPLHYVRYPDGMTEWIRLPNFRHLRHVAPPPPALCPHPDSQSPAGTTDTSQDTCTLQATVHAARQELLPETVRNDELSATRIP